MFAILAPKPRERRTHRRAEFERPQRRDLQQVRLELAHVVVLQGHVPRFGVAHRAIFHVLERDPLDRRYGRVAEERDDDAPDVAPQMLACSGARALDHEPEARQVRQRGENIDKGVVCAE